MHLQTQLWSCWATAVIIILIITPFFVHIGQDDVYILIDYCRTQTSSSSSSNAVDRFIDKIITGYMSSVVNNEGGSGILSENFCIRKSLVTLLRNHQSMVEV